MSDAEMNRQLRRLERALPTLGWRIKHVSPVDAAAVAILLPTGDGPRDRLLAAARTFLDAVEEVKVGFRVSATELETLAALRHAARAATSSAVLDDVTVKTPGDAAHGTFAIAANFASDRADARDFGEEEG